MSLEGPSLVPSDRRPTRLGGPVRASVSTALVGLYRELFGRGPVKTRAYEFEAGVVIFVSDLLLQHERVLLARGHGDLVQRSRAAARELGRGRLSAEVERLTGRRALHEFHELRPDLDLAMEVVLLEEPSRNGAASAEAARGPLPEAESELRERAATA